MADRDVSTVDGPRPDKCAAGDSSGADVLLLGAGDVAQGDLGAAIHVLRRLEREVPITGVRLRDGGTAGIELLPEVGAVRALILIMAVANGRPPGTLTYRQPRDVVELPDGFARHECAVRDLFAAAALLGRLPDVHLYTISVGSAPTAGPGLSAAVAEAIPLAVSIAHGHAMRLTLPAAGH